MRGITLVLVAAMAVLLTAACGGGEDGPAPGATDSPTAITSPDVTPAERRSVAPAQLCQMSREPSPSYNVQVTARWEGKDRIVIEGSADLPGPGSVNYWICQDGELSASLRWARPPTFENGKIRAESELLEAPIGPVFDPNARFEVVLSILGEPVQVPYFMIRVPVEGKPE